MLQRKGLPHSDGQPVVAVRRWRHNWRYAHPAACRDNTRPVFGYADSAGGRVFGCSKGKAVPDNLAFRPRHFLPKDLAGALKRLDDAEIDALLAAVTAEAGRRGRPLPNPANEKSASAAKPQLRHVPTEDDAVLLTTGKLNAVRAAFKAGVKRLLTIGRSADTEHLKTVAHQLSVSWRARHKVGVP